MNTLREAHAHVAAHGREMSQLNLVACPSRVECLDLLRQETARLDRSKEPGWLVATGARVEAWAGAPGGPVWPTMAELDAASPRRPCMVQSFDHHACAVNAAALAAAGFTSTSPDPAGGRLVRDAAGDFTGLLLESAYGAVRRAVPEPSREQWKEYLRAAMQDLSRHGFVEVHDLLSPRWLGPVLAELDAAGELPMSVWLYPLVEDLGAVAASRNGWERGRVRLAGGKVFADGTLNSRTAWMLEPYADALPGMPHGQAMVSPVQLDAALERTSELGVGLAVHAIGDGAVRAVLDAFARSHVTRLRRNSHGVREAPGGGVPALRVEHAELVDAADVPRFAELGVVCSVQPCHLLYDIEALTKGQPGRLDRVLPLRELERSGCRPGELMWFGSDVPIVRPHPEDSIRAAVKRRRADAPEGAAIGPGQAISEAEAWRAFGVDRV